MSADTVTLCCCVFTAQGDSVQWYSARSESEMSGTRGKAAVMWRDAGKPKAIPTETKVTIIERLTRSETMVELLVLLT